MNKRLQLLESMVAAGTADAFARYGLAMEYRTLGRHEDALAAFHALRAAEPTYLPMYLMAAQLLVETGDPHAARGWLTPGLELARQQGNGKAESEIEALLEELG